MPKLIERVSRHLPHMASDSMKVVGEDGKVYDSEAWFPGPAPEVAGAPPETELVAIGVVEAFFGAKLHHGATPEEVIQAEAKSFSGRIDDMVDFGVFDFSGEQLASIEDMVAYVQQTEPEKAPDFVHEAQGAPHGNGGGGRRGRGRQRGRRGRRDFRQQTNGRAPSPGQPAESPAAPETAPSSPPPPTDEAPPSPPNAPPSPPSASFPAE